MYIQNKNVEYTLDAVYLAKRFGCDTFIGAGSQAEYGIVNEDEHSGAKKMLTSAALTYVAGVLATLAEILRYILIFTGRDNR